ncbi:MAG: hypothetical protein P1V35_02700 [Planctomycetota bacterium]|nr:hypothetical protein [Planctomycetota bacterium]
MKVLHLIGSVVLAVPAAALQMPAGINVAWQGTNQVEVPAQTYAAAAGQAGVWNRFWLTGQVPPLSSGLLLDLDNNLTTVSIEITSGPTNFISSNNMPFASGDDALLLANGLSMTPFDSGIHFQIHGLPPGRYRMYTYGLIPDLWGGTVVSAANEIKQTQWFGSFEHGYIEDATHTIHTLVVQPGVPVDASAWPITTNDDGCISGIQIVPADGVPAFQYCDSNANSTGNMSTLLFAGTESLLENDFQIGVRNLPLNQFGYFLVSRNQGTGISPPGSQGILCIGGHVGRFNRPGEIVFSGTLGSALLSVDLADIPQPQGSVSIMPGETWNWQFWHRDSNPTSTSNFSDGHQVTFIN